jgi:hypothetical protein
MSVDECVQIMDPEPLLRQDKFQFFEDVAESILLTDDCKVILLYADHQRVYQ